MRVAVRSSAVQQKLLNWYKGRDIAPLNLKLGDRRKWMVNITLRSIEKKKKNLYLLKWRLVGPRTSLDVSEDEQISSDQDSDSSEQHNLE
jgi:hypothetical protein